MESKESVPQTAKKNHQSVVTRKYKIIFEIGFKLFASILAITCGSVQLASHNNDKWRQYLQLNDSTCAIIMIVTGCIILGSLLFRLAIKYFPKNRIQWIREHDSISNKIVIGLLGCCALLLFIAIVLSFADIKAVNETDVTAMVQVLDSKYVQNNAVTTVATTPVPTQFLSASTIALPPVPPPSPNSSSPYKHFKDSINVEVVYATVTNYDTSTFSIMSSSETDDADFSCIVDMTQHMLECCGVESYTDWSSTDWGRSHPASVPDSCCIQRTSNCGINFESTNVIFTEGCFTVIARKIITKAVTSVVVSMIVIILDVISAKYESILKICPSCLKQKVMKKMDARAMNSNDDDGLAERKADAKAGTQKDNQIEEINVHELVIHMYSGAVNNDDGNWTPVQTTPPETFKFSQIPTKGSLHICRNPEGIEINTITDKFSNVFKSSHIKNIITENAVAVKSESSSCLNFEDKIKELKQDNDNLQHTVEVFKEQIRKLESQLADFKKETTNYNENLANRDLQDEITKLATENVNLQRTVGDLSEHISKLECQTTESKRKPTDGQEEFSILVGCIEEAENIVQNAINEINNPLITAISSIPGYLLTLSTCLPTFMERLQAQFSTSSKNSEDFVTLLKSVTSLSHVLGQLLVHVKATAANIFPKMDQRDKLMALGHALGIDTLHLLSSMKLKGSNPQVQTKVNKLLSDVQAMQGIAETLVASQAVKVEDKIEESIDQQLSDMDQTFEEFTAHIAELKELNTIDNSGSKVEDHDKILDSCNALMQSIKVLMKCSKQLQHEILAQGNGSASVIDFYRQNHQWTEGLISAAKEVGFGAQFLVDAADAAVVSGQSKFETLLAPSQAIAASTAHLESAAKAKANPASENYKAMSLASKDVRDHTCRVKETVKEYMLRMEDEVMDVGNLACQAKYLEIEALGRIGELERTLEKERKWLSQMRKNNCSGYASVE